MSVPGEKELSNATETQAPAPKKRGRKRKSEIVPKQVEEIIEIVPREETISRRGRPRKKVNYYELANPDNLDFPIQLEKELVYDVENEEMKNNKKRKTGEKSYTDADTIPKNEMCVSNLEESSIVEQDESGSSINGRHEENVVLPNGKEDVSNSSKEVNLSIDDVTTSLEATTSSPRNKDKKYHHTGETVKMMNTLFTLFHTDETAAQDSTNVNNTSSSTLNSSNNGKRPYRKSKKSNVKDSVKEEDVDDDSGNITCAVCNTAMDKSLWSHHKQRYHNNLAWRVGDPPLDLNDQSFVMHTLNTLYKKKKPLYCDKCGSVKKSVVGFLSHRSQCLKSEEELESVKIACEVCGRKMLPVSMSTHMKMLHQEPSEKEKDISENPKNENSKNLPSKRSAAKKAMRIIETVTKNDEQEKYFSTNLDFGSQEFAKALLEKELKETQFVECKFRCNCITTNMEDALKHMEECTERLDEGFVCKWCLTILPKLEEIIYHIEFTHEITVNSDGDNDDPSFVEKGSKLPPFLRTPVRRTEKVLFPFAFEWCYKFCEENYSNYLYADLSFNQSNWRLLSRDQAASHLPKMNESCDTARIHVTSFINPLSNVYVYKKYKLFESEIHDNKITIFCGGPISAMAWVPTSYQKTSENQILAVSVLNSPDDKYLTYENFEVDTAIQFWSFGPLQNQKYSLEEPKLVFSLAHSHGPVWHMEWCPSGCYNVERMGLVAVTGSDSVVYIYSVPFFNEEKMGLYYKSKPVMKLLLQRPESPLLGGLKYYPSRISWSKAKGHQYISVGYTNGFIALFNIKSSSVMLKFEDADGIPCFLPSKCFQAHAHTITALVLYHMDGGCRWLMTGSMDRRVSVWDLHNHNYPICNTKKNIVTDGFWMTNWLCYVTTSDEGSTSANVTAMLKQVRDYSYDPSVTLTCSMSTISATSGSDWLNGILHANTVGEIIGLFPHQILQFPEHQKVLKSKRMLFGYASLIEKNKTPQERVDEAASKKKTLQSLVNKKQGYSVKLSKIKADFDSDRLFANEPAIYDQAEQKYALLFCDNAMKSYEHFPKTTAKQLTALSKLYGATTPNQYPLNSINKIVFNPNRQASLYFATGYQAGFVRISWLEFLKDDSQIK